MGVGVFVQNILLLRQQVVKEVGEKEGRSLVPLLVLVQLLLNIEAVLLQTFIFGLRISQSSLNLFEFPFELIDNFLAIVAVNGVGLLLP